MPNDLVMKKAPGEPFGELCGGKTRRMGRGTKGPQKEGYVKIRSGTGEKGKGKRTGSWRGEKRGGGAGGGEAQLVKPPKRGVKG